MNREEAKVLAPYVEAFGNGEDVQYRLVGCGDKPWWSLGANWTLGPHATDPGYCEYRIKSEPCGEKNVELEASTAAMQPIIDAAIDFVVAENMDALGPYVAQRRRTLNALHDEVGKYLEKDL